MSTFAVLAILLAQVLLSKYADHLPLYRQAQIYARQDVNLDRSTLTDWAGRAAFLLRPVYGPAARRSEGSTDCSPTRPQHRSSIRAENQDRPALFAVAPIRQASTFVYAPDLKAVRPFSHLGGFVAVLQVDGYVGCRALAERKRRDPRVLLGAWRRKPYLRELARLPRRATIPQHAEGLP